MTLALFQGYRCVTKKEAANFFLFPPLSAVFYHVTQWHTCTHIHTADRRFLRNAFENPFVHEQIKNH